LSKLSQGAARGLIICKWEGKFIQALVFNLGASSISIAEATTQHSEIKSTIQAIINNVQIEGYDKILI